MSQTGTNGKSAQVAIIGTGWGVRVQVPAFRHVGLQIGALWGRTAEKTNKIVKSLNIPFGTIDYQAILNNPEIDLISITTPPHTHAEMSIAAIKAGKHVLCEKPTALNVAEVETMAATAKTYPQQLALIDHELRFLPTRQKMRMLLQEGYVGHIFHVNLIFQSDWLLNVDRRWNWWSNQEKGGGLLGAIGSHLLDQLVWLLNQRVTAVSGLERTFIKARPDETGQPCSVTSDDYTLVQLQLDDCSAAMELSGVAPGQNLHRIQIVGSKGCLIYENETLQGWQIDQNGKSGPVEDLTLTETITLPENYPASDFPRGTIFLGQALKVALETGDFSPLAPAATFADSLHIQEVIDAIRHSNRKETWIYI